MNATITIMNIANSDIKSLKALATVLESVFSRALHNIESLEVRKRV